MKEFHKLYPDGNISTELILTDEKRVIVKANVSIPYKNPNISGPGIGAISWKNFTGFSQAEWGKGPMGSVALEVAETSAIGRALGFANIGLLDGIASADEMRKVTTVKRTITNQEDDGVPF